MAAARSIFEVREDNLYKELCDIEQFNRAIMVRGGRLVRDRNIEVNKMDLYLKDHFQWREGTSVPKRKKTIVIETLYCSGAGNCQRGCGGFGQCLEGCQLKHQRSNKGHRCSFKVQLKMMSNSIGTWQVQVQGEHVPPLYVWEAPSNGISHMDRVINKKKFTKIVQENPEKSHKILLLQIPSSQRPTKREARDIVLRENKKPKVCLVDYPSSESESEGNFFGL